MSIREAYAHFVHWIGDGTGVSDALLHVHGGMFILLVARLVTRRSLATPIPFAVVCVAALVKEILDRIYHDSWRWADTSLDVLNTLLWPFVLMVGLRIRRSREGRATDHAGADQPSDGSKSEHYEREPGAESGSP